MNPQFFVDTLTQSRNELLATARASQEDKLAWSPLDKGRTIGSMLAECAYTATQTSLMVANKGEFATSVQQFMEGMKAVKDQSREQSLQEIESATADLFATILSFSKEQMDREITVEGHSGPFSMPVSGWLMMLHRSFISRFAQINYIQRLYGDDDFHNG